MTTLLLHNIDTLATFDEDRRRLAGAWVLIRDNQIEAVGQSGTEPEQADQRIDLAGHVVLPGMVNTHHHQFQSLLRNVPSMQDSSLFRWLRDIYLLMSELTDEDLYVSSLINHAELLLSGCTTAVDHHYIKVNDVRFDTCFDAARDIGIRFQLARGSMSVSQSTGGLPPDHIVEKEDDILADSERLLQRYHDPQPGAMARVALAPCSPFSVSPHLMQESVALARRYGASSHTHLAESPDDERYVQETYGKTSVQMAEDWGWVGPDVWYAHAVTLNDDDIAIMGRTGTGVAHCPNSNMYTAAGCCRVPALLQAGATVAIGVDGSAANNASNMLDEVRNALLLQRVFQGADALSATQALELAVLGGAKLLRRDDIGVIAPGKMADLIAVDTRQLAMSGGLHDPLAGLVLCETGRVALSIVNGRVLVSDGQLVGVDLRALIDRQNKLAEALLARCEKRYGVSLSTQAWRRAYPYQPRVEAGSP
jgi:8-oxoguanine deaminase